MNTEVLIEPEAGPGYEASPSVGHPGCRGGTLALGVQSKSGKAPGLAVVIKVSNATIQ